MEDVGICGDSFSCKDSVSYLIRIFHWLSVPKKRYCRFSGNFDGRSLCDGAGNEKRNEMESVSGEIVLGCGSRRM